MKQLTIPHHSGRSTTLINCNAAPEIPPFGLISIQFNSIADFETMLLMGKTFVPVCYGKFRTGSDYTPNNLWITVIKAGFSVVGT